MQTTSSDNDIDVMGLTAISALGSSQQGLAAWTALNESIPFDLLPHTVIRAMPQIYLNLQGLSPLIEGPRLRGVYRASWSNNAVRFAAARELFIAFNKECISYRVIKGGAISAIIGHWGLRRMGDIDVVIAPEHETRAIQILHEFQYFQRVAETKNQVLSNRFVEGSWQNDRGAVIDLHSISGKPRIFSSLFAEQGSMSLITNTPIHIPSPELMFGLAVWHGKKATAGTDQIQTLLDLGTLVHHVKFNRMKSVLIQSNLVTAAEYYLSELERLELIQPVERNEWNQRSWSERITLVQAHAQSIINIGARASTLPSVARSRRLNKIQRQALTKEPGIRARAYQLWSNVGHVRPLERLMITRFGGFGDFTDIGGPIPDRDFRIRIPAIQGKPGRLKIHFTFNSEDQERSARALFIDGLIQGHVPLPGNVPGTYEITPENDYVEVSARCFSSDLSISIVRWIAEWEDS